MMRAKFTPAIRNGKPSEAEIGVNYRIGRAYKEMMRRRELEATKTTNEPTIIEGGVLNGRALSLAKPVYPVLRVRSASQVRSVFQC